MSNNDTSVSPPEVGSSQATPTNRGRNQNPRRRQQRAITTNSTSYQGQCEDIGCIIALGSERYDKKVQYQVFIEKMNNYVISNLKDGGDMQCVYTNLRDPTDEFQQLHKPAKPVPDVFGGIDLNNILNA